NWKMISVNAPENIHDASSNAQSHDHNHEQDDTQEGGHEARDYMPLYYCPEEGCTSAFTRYRDLMKHMENGRHHYQTMRQDLREYAIDRYKAHIDNMQLLQPIPFVKKAMMQLSQTPRRTTGTVL